MDHHDGIILLSGLCAGLASLGITLLNGTWNPQWVSDEVREKEESEKLSVRYWIRESLATAVIYVLWTCVSLPQYTGPFGFSTSPVTLYNEYIDKDSPSGLFTLLRGISVKIITLCAYFYVPLEPLSGIEYPR
ncbi:hypothetical protein BDW59DRAFT_163579 [Aspergillus cavernicola]|uniref:Uncharacterized protein n=1 Tax=Aspergillus cavernicola TaxID=176166 RepID=A0ABR4I552_9EURO